MAIISPPDDDTLKALGRLTLYFAELEFSLNWCLYLLRLPKTDADAKRLIDRVFTQRVKDFKTALLAEAGPGGKLDKQSLRHALEFKPDLLELGERRNLLVHGAAYNFIEERDGSTVWSVYKISSRSGKREDMNAKQIDALVLEVQAAAEKLTLLTSVLYRFRRRRARRPPAQIVPWLES